MENNMKINKLDEILKANEYPGRGIVAGLSADGKYAVSAYWTMGRSAGSRTDDEENTQESSRNFAHRNASFNCWFTHITEGTAEKFPPARKMCGKRE